MQQNLWIPWETTLEVLGGARAGKVKVCKTWGFATDLENGVGKVSGKSLVQGQADLTVTMAS